MKQLKKVKEKPLSKYLGKCHSKSVMASIMPLRRNNLSVSRSLKTRVAPQERSRGRYKREIEKSGPAHSGTWIVFCDGEVMYIFDRRAK